MMAILNNLDKSVDQNTFYQYVHEPSRTDGTGHVLDLLLCNVLDVVHNVRVFQGSSDHNVVLRDLSALYVRVARKPRRKIHTYSRANYEAINAAFESFFPTFDALADNLYIEQLWNAFKQKMFELRDAFVPSRDISSRRARDKPWFSAELRALVRRQRRT